MKLLYVLGSFYPAQRGGPNNTTYWAARELARRGTEVTVASLKDGLSPNHLEQYAITLNTEIRLDGMRVWYFNYAANRYLSWAMFRWLVTNIKHYDMVNLTSVFFPWTWVAALLCILYRVPFSIAPRGELEPGAYRYGKLYKDLVSRLFLKRLLARARFVLVTSEQEEAYTRAFFPNKIPFETVPNYMEVGEETLSQEPVQQKQNILYLGRIHPKKGIENLIEAFGRLNRKILGNHQLLIAGSGNADYVESLKQLALSSKRAADIHFIGHKDSEAKKRVYQQAKVMVLPSHSENFGNVVVEALAHSTPVIASKLTPWAGLETGKCGLWVENDPASLARALETILSLDAENYTATAMAARRFVTENYDIRKNGGKLEALYKSHLP